MRKLGLQKSGVLLTLTHKPIFKKNTDFILWPISAVLYHGLHIFAWYLNRFLNSIC